MFNDSNFNYLETFKLVFDENMIVKKAVSRPGIKYYGVSEPQFRVCGVIYENGCFVRMPKAVAETVSTGIAQDYVTCAGGRIRFVTDSPYVAVSAEISHIYQFPIMSIEATCGIDVYADGRFLGIVRPNVDNPVVHISDVVNMRESGEHIVEINLPLYVGVKDIVIGLDENAVLKSAPDYTYDKPAVFYGSSITNGACASRPGLAYPARISRMLDLNYINLGFGGLCKGEREMAEYIASLDMSVFGLDYDYNASDPEYLAATHENVYKTVREKNPDLPIIMISAPKFTMTEVLTERKNIIKRTYDNAKAAGDKNVYIIYGDTFFGEIGDDFSVDNVHPTDLGFDYMAKAICPVIKNTLEDK